MNPTLAEFLALCAAAGTPAGARAAMEFVADSAGVLAAGGPAGWWTPWTVGLTLDGSPSLEAAPVDMGPAGTDDELRYCPPEGVRGGPATQASCVYGLGLLAFELATGRPLFSGSDEGLRNAVGRADVVPLLFRAEPVLPPSVQRVLREALRADPQDRPAPADLARSALSALSDPELSGPRLAAVLQLLAPGAADAAATVDSHASSLGSPADTTRFLEVTPRVVGARPAARPMSPVQTFTADPMDDPATPVFRAPEAVAPRLGGPSRSFKLRLGPGGPKLRLRLAEGLRCADAVAFLEGSVLTPRLDLDGRPGQGWRLGSLDGPLPGGRQLGSLPVDAELMLHPIGPRVRGLHMVLGTERRPIEVCGLVRVGSLADALVAEWGLEGRGWAVHRGAERLGVHLLCEELGPDDDLQLRRG